MALKAALLALAVLIAWMVLFRPASRRTGAPPRGKSPPSQELEPCPRCGVYRLPGGSCDCDQRPTSGD